MPQEIALQVNRLDNVATVFAAIAAGSEIKVADPDGAFLTLSVINDIPYGHKAALKPINSGEPIIKYGETIGVANRMIRPGEHVHIHNLDSTRGRGDRVQGGADR